MAITSVVLHIQYIQVLEVGKLDLFTVFQGIQFLPLDKYIYLKIHCFINQVETAFRYVLISVDSHSYIRTLNQRYWLLLSVCS